MPHCILVLDASPVRPIGAETDPLIADKNKNPATRKALGKKKKA